MPLRKEEEQDRQPVRLTPTQEAAGRLVISTLTEANSRTLLILDGLKGVGKTSLLKTICTELESRGAKIVEPTDLSSPRQEHKTHPGHFVTTTHPGSYTDRENLTEALKRFQGIAKVTHTLKAMTPEEISNILGSVPNSIVVHSLGIPLLAQKLMAATSLGEQHYSRITASYIRRAAPFAHTKEALAKFSRKYLQTEVPENVAAEVERLSGSLSSERIYDWAYTTFEQQMKLKQKGKFEEDPLFLAPESEPIYDAMLNKPRERWNNLDIFIPAISSSDLERLQEAFGYNCGYDRHDGTRAEMCCASYRKVSFWQKDWSGYEYGHDNEFEQLERIVKKYQEAHTQGKLGIPGDPSKKCQFFVHAHDHDDSPLNPSLIGLAVESLLQQRGIPYFVNNYLVDKSYIYNPKTRHIKVLPRLVEIKSY